MTVKSIFKGLKPFKNEGKSSKHGLKSARNFYGIPSQSSNREDVPSLLNTDNEQRAIFSSGGSPRSPHQTNEGTTGGSLPAHKSSRPPRQVRGLLKTLSRLRSKTSSKDGGSDEARTLQDASCNLPKSIGSCQDRSGMAGELIRCCLVDEVP